MFIHKPIDGKINTDGTQPDDRENNKKKIIYDSSCEQNRTYTSVDITTKFLFICSRFIISLINLS